VPPETEVVLGLWRAEALVTGERIVKVSFLVDGKTQLTRSRRPFSAELRLSQFPVQQVVRAEGYDAAGELVAADEVILNQTRGAFGVEIAEPPRGFVGYGTVRVRAEVTVPEERRVERVELRLNDTTFATLALPPWTAEVEIPEGDEVTYLSAVATLDDGRQAEAVRFLNAPQFLEEVEVRLVELYVSVIDRSNRPVLGLGQDDFEVLERGVPQEITKFELVENLPLSVGITIDTSGSMVQALAEAQRAGQDFLSSVMTPRDRCFVIGFAQSPELLMAPTDDTEACLFGLAELRAVGSTSLHDAVVTSLYYFRGMKGQRALVLLSDGDDTSSNIAFPAALEYARRSGVAIYPVGLGVSALGFNVRSKLSQLAEETGGRVFFIGKAEELAGVYDDIEQELRSRYLLAYNAKPPPPEAAEEEFREVEIEVGRRGLRARTVRGYYQ
jgi:VWFA-related protein